MAKKDWIMNVESLLHEALTFYHPTTQVESIWNFNPCPGSGNNVVYYVEATSDNVEVSEYSASALDMTKKYVIRLYNNGLDNERVKFEHEVLQRIDELNPIIPFLYPKPVQSVDHGLTYVQLSNGVQACLFPFIKGSIPSLLCTEPIGMACAMTSNILHQVTLQFSDDKLSRCPTRPYYELWKAHHAIDRDKFYELVTSSIYDDVHSQIAFLVNQVAIMEDILILYHTLNLPKQLIHGDLQVANILCDDNNIVTGVLDFEFVAYDWRAMDLAINLSPYCNLDDALPLIDTFMHGYGPHYHMSMKEIRCIPDLISLRILNNVIYFVSRASVGEDSPHSIISRASSYQNKIEFLQAKKSDVIDTIAKHFIAHNNLLPDD